MSVFSQSFFAFMSRHFMSFSFFSTRHNTKTNKIWLNLYYFNFLTNPENSFDGLKEGIL